MNFAFVIFDLDGTLIDSSDGVVDAVNYSLRQLGQPEQPPERIKPYIGYPLSSMYPEFTTAPYEELYRQFQTRAAETIVASTSVLDGVENTLRLLRGAGVAMAIASTKVGRHVQGIVEKFGWQDMFSALVGGDDVAHVKPQPDAFISAVEMMQADPGRTVVVGDTENDILAAHAAGLPAVAVTPPYGGEARLRAAAPEFFIERIADIAPIVLNGTVFGSAR